MAQLFLAIKKLQKGRYTTNAGAASLRAVSVRAPSCLLAGSLSTLAMLLPERRGLRLLGQSGLAWLAFAQDGTLRGTLQPPLPAPAALRTRFMSALKP